MELNIIFNPFHKFPIFINATIIHQENQVRHFLVNMEFCVLLSPVISFDFTYITQLSQVEEHFRTSRKT